LTKKLENLRYSVIASTDSGEKSITAARKAKPDLILMDIHMPGQLNGLDAARVIKKELGIPIIFTTMETDESIISQAIGLNPYGYLLKPFNDHDLKIAIEMAFYRNEIDKKLQKNSNYITNILECMSDGIIVINPEGQIKTVNDTTCHLLGKSKKELIGQYVADFFPNSSHTALENFGEEFQITNRIGEKLEILRKRKVVHANNEIQYAIDTLTDISHHKELENFKLMVEKEKLIREQDTLNIINWKEMYGTKDMHVFEKIMYSLNTSVNSMGGTMLLEFLISNIEQKGEEYYFSKEIYDSLIELNDELQPLFNNLAEIEKLIQAKIAVQPMNLEDIVNNVLDVIKGQYNNSKTKENPIVIANIPDNSYQYQINTNLDYLSECFDELITNSIKYAPPHTKILIEISIHEKEVEFKVVNQSAECKIGNQTILGIPYEYSELVFNPFERLHRILPFKYKEKWSFGLGLYVVRKIVEKMGGKIDCHNGMCYLCYTEPKPITSFIMHFKLLS
ncbi:MAG: response regulator, partial [Spirochaetes bacterium]|nr:response regulator [Spirochaetota bacterium]